MPTNYVDIPTYNVYCMIIQEFCCVEEILLPKNTFLCQVKPYNFYCRKKYNFLSNVKNKNVPVPL